MGAVAAEGGSNKIKNTRSAKDSFGRIREPASLELDELQLHRCTPMNREDSEESGEVLRRTSRPPPPRPHRPAVPSRGPPRRPPRRGGPPLAWPRRRAVSGRCRAPAG